MAVFDESRALQVRRFIESLSLTKGDWAGQPFRLLDWQWELVVKPAFGTLKEPDGPRQYRFVYIEIPKKNGKTPLAAAIALYMLCADGEASPEVYFAAADREQAGYGYMYAKEMVEAHPVLCQRLKVIDSRKRIIYPKQGNKGNNGFLQVLSAESYTKHGINPSCIIIDELHAQPNDELYYTLTSGTHYARKQQLVLILTTAGVYDPESIWWRVRDRAIKIASGMLDDPSFLPVLFIADRNKDDPGDEEVWKRVNPSLGHIFSLEKIREEYQIAKNSPRELNDFLRFRLNIPTAEIAKYIDPDVWKRNGGVVDEAGLAGRECYAGLDLSTTTDISALVYVFPPSTPEGRIDVVCRFWLPEEGITRRARRDTVPYHIWARHGWLKLTPGDVLDYGYILRQIEQDMKIFDVRELAFDRWGSQKLVADLLAMGFDSDDRGGYRRLIQFGQGYGSMNAPTKELETLLYAGRINHGYNPVLTWMASNMVVRMDSAGNIKPDKDKSIDRIDGMVALIMALDRFTRNTNRTSVYEERGVLVL